MRADVPWREEVVSGVPPIVDGHVLPPTGPGIGVDLNESAAAHHPYISSMPVRWVHEDGGTAEW